MVKILREADRTPVADVAKKCGVSEQTIYNWRQHFGSLQASDVKRLTQLESENSRLKKLVAPIDVAGSIRSKRVIEVLAESGTIYIENRTYLNRAGMGLGTNLRNRCVGLGCGGRLSIKA